MAALPNWQAIAANAARNAGISPAIFVRQITAESSGNPAARSPAGAVGIAQFMPGTARSLGINPLNPVQALRAAAQLDAQRLRAYGGDWQKTLAAYNAGPGNVGRWQSIPETRAYVNSILGSTGAVPPSARVDAGAARPLPRATPAAVPLPALSPQDAQRVLAGLAPTRAGQVGRMILAGQAPGSALLRGFRFASFNPKTGGFQLATDLAGGTPIPLPPSAGGYVNPLSGFGLGRTDMGVDFTGAGPVRAIGDALVTRVQGQNTNSGWPGAGDGGRGTRGAVIAYQLLNGPMKGRYVYTAENIDPTAGLHVGSRVTAGQQIATARGAFPFLETGWAANPRGTTLASATTGYREGQATTAGQSFLNFLRTLGVR